MTARGRKTPTSFSASRLGHLFGKEMRETFRDWKMLSLTLTFAPFFVLLMQGYLNQSTQVYQVAVVSHFDAGPRAWELAESMAALRTPEGEVVLEVREAEPEEVESLLQSRKIDLAVFLPGGFSEALERGATGPPATLLPPLPVRTRGDPGNPDYIMAAVWADVSLMTFAGMVTGIHAPVVPAPETVTGSSSLTDFDLYVPGLLALSLMMLMFTAAAALIREKDRGTIIRLRLSNLTVLEWLTAVSVTQVITGLLALILTFLTALAIGYRTPGSVPLLLLVGALTSLSIMGVSILVAAYLRTVFDLVTVGCFPFFILMFFSGGMIPLPGVPLFQVGERVVELNEILPTTHAIKAMEGVLNYGAGVDAIAYELWAILVLTLAFFASGTWIFTRRHMRGAR